MRIRLKYSVKGRIRFISHLDLMRAFFRACIRKNIPVVVSQGYSPHLKLSFGPPLSVGMSSCCEYVDIYLERAVGVEKLKENLQEGLPEGVRIEEIYSVSESLPALSAVIDGAVYSVRIPQEYLDDVKDRIQDFLRKGSIVIERKKKNVGPVRKNKVLKSAAISGKILKYQSHSPKGTGFSNGVDIRPLVKELTLEDSGRLLMCVALGEKGSVRPIEVISSLWSELELDELKLWQINREKLFGL